jgi:hypothetical protein
MAQSKSDLLNEIKKLQLEILDLEKRTASLTEDEIKAQERLKNAIVRKAREVRKINEEQQKSQKDLITAVGEQEAAIKSISTMYAPIKEIEKQRVKALGESNIRSQHNVDVLGRAQAINEKIANLTSDDIVQKQALNMELEQELGSLRGRGAALDYQKSLLMESNQLANQYAGLTEKQRDFLQKQLNVYEGIKDTIGGVLETAKLLTSTVGGVLGTALIGASVAGGKLLSTQRELGGQLLDNTNISTTLFGTIFPNAVETTKSLSKEFGGLNDVSLQTQFRTNILSKNLGISVSEAASLTGSFARLNNGSAETAENLMVSTKELAMQNGLVPADIMADVAGSAEAFALFGKDGGKNIAEAAIAAGKLGVSMSQISGVADNLLDFESSINAELELGAMLGKNINLDRARALAYEGDIGGSVRETLSALGGIEAFNKMDYFQKKQTAALLGVSVEEFQKMAVNADKLNKDGSIQVSQYQAMKETLMGVGEQGLGLLKTLGSTVIAAGQLGFNMKGIGGTMKGIVGGIGQKFKSLLGMGGGAGMDAFSAAKAKGLSDKQILSGFGGKDAKDMMTNTPQKSLSGSANPAGKGGMMDSMSKINMNAVLKGAAAMVIVAGAVFIFGKAVQEFMKVSWEAVGMAVVSMLALVGAVALLGAIMTSGVGAVAILAGAAAMLVIAASVLVLGHALQAIGTGFEMMSTGIQSLMPKLMAVATTIGGLVTLIPSIALLAYSIMGLSGSLVALGVAGLLAAPGLMALNAVGAISTGLNTIMGGEEGGGGSDSALIEEIRGLRADLNDGKVGVYMDGQKVTAAISKVVNKIGSNSYAIV